jgi:hypothetical protein
MGALKCAAVALLFILPQAFAQSIGTIKRIDMDDSKPQNPDYILVDLTIKKPRPGQGHFLLRQFSNRVRVEFEGAGLVKGTYTIGVASGCSHGSLTEARYKAAWRELHRFPSTPTHISTEKSVPGASLKDPAAKLMFTGKAIALFHLSNHKYDVIDCKTVK